jgi:hypothetical protein
MQAKWDEMFGEKEEEKKVEGEGQPAELKTKKVRGRKTSTQE